MATHVAVAVAPPPGGATPAVTTGAPLTGATAVAPAPLGTAPALLVLTPVVQVVVAMPWKTGMGLAGPLALESSSLVSSKGPVEKGGARRRSSRGDPLPPVRNPNMYLAPCLWQIFQNLSEEQKILKGYYLSQDSFLFVCVGTL